MRREVQMVVDIARHVVADIERSGYGTDREDRWMPHFEPTEVALLAQTILLLAGELPLGGER